MGTKNFFIQEKTISCSIFNSFCHPHLDNYIDKFEDVSRNFTKQIPEIRKESYWDILRVLKINLEFKRIVRYKIMYIWKVLETKVPNPGIQTVPLHEHREECVMFLSQEIIKE